MSEPLKLTREQWESIDFSDFAAEARSRGKVLVPVQYYNLFRRIMETQFWPALYDADGKFIGEPPPAEKPSCAHDWRYDGTDYHGSHKGEDSYTCTKCHASEYRA